MPAHLKLQTSPRETKLAHAGFPPGVVSEEVEASFTLAAVAPSPPKLLHPLDKSLWLPNPPKVVQSEYMRAHAHDDGREEDTPRTICSNKISHDGSLVLLREILAENVYALLAVCESIVHATGAGHVGTVLDGIVFCARVDQVLATGCPLQAVQALTDYYVIRTHPLVQL